MVNKALLGHRAGLRVDGHAPQSTGRLCRHTSLQE